MDIESLHAYLILSQQLHFGRASRLSAMSISTLSRTIRRLEAEIGKPLFIRDSRRVILTPAGIAFQAFVQETVASLENLRATLSSEKELSGTIQLYCSVTASYTLLPDILNRFRIHHPAVTIAIETGDAEMTLDRLQTGAADIGISVLPDSLPSKVLTKPLATIPLCLISYQHDVKAIDLELTPFILPARGIAKNRIEKWFKAQRISPVVRGRVSGFEGIVSLVRLGYGIGIVPKQVIEMSPFRHQIHVISIQPELPILNVGLCVQKRNLGLPIVKALWESI